MLEKLKNFENEYNVVGVYGGKNYDTQKSKIQDGVDMIVGTPGRLIDMLNRGDLKLDKLKSIVLDETDVMLDFGFEPEISKILNIISQN